MAIFEITSDTFRKISETTFESVNLRERHDLQRLLRLQIDVVAPDVLVISEEFGDWQESRRRIDLLGLDRDANLVVIELKRTEDGGHMDLQAVRYAAMVSAMTFENAADVYAAHLHKVGEGGDARERMLSFLDWTEPDEDRFGQDVRIVLVAAEFSTELTTTVMWLNERGLDMRCVRMRPHADGERVLVDVQQVIPLPEAADYIVSLKEKGGLERIARSDRSNLDLARFWVGLLALAKGKTPLHATANVSIPGGLRDRDRTGIGSWYYVVGPRAGPRVELYLDLSTEQNKANFDRLFAARSEIESRFEGALGWERMDGKNACRIRSEVEGPSFRDEGAWGSLQAKMIEAMIRLEKALRPALDGIDSKGRAFTPVPSRP